ncbi:MAG: malonyl-ACP O-methyltransferase BioC [Gammaproteobacteria bacterium]
MSESAPPEIDKRRVARAFDAAARRYDAVAELQATVASRNLERLDYIRIEPRTVLDLGAGTGTGARALRRRYRRARFVLVDLAHEMLRQAKARRAFLAREAYVRSDAERLPFADAAFDLVYSNLMLQWCPHPDEVFRGVKRILAPGGLFMFATFGPDTLMELRRAWSAADAVRHVHAFADMHDLGDGLIRAGFASPVLDNEHIVMTYADLRGLLADIRDIGAACASPDRRRALTGKQAWRRFAEEYDAQRSEGRLPATYEIVYGHAWAPLAGTRPQDGSTVAVQPIRIVPRRPA